MSLDAMSGENFLLTEESGREESIFTYIQGLQEIISNLNPRTVSEKRRLQLSEAAHTRSAKVCTAECVNENMDLQ